MNKLKVGLRVFYVAKDYVFNSFIKQIYKNKSVLLRDGQIRYEFDLYLTREDAMKALNDSQKDKKDE